MRKETKIISGTSFVTKWTYNLADLPKTMTYPDGEIVTTHYDNNMLPIDVRGMSNYVPSMTYDIAGRLRTRALGNGLTQTYEYYPWNQQGGRLKILATGTLQNLTYQYDSVGNITQTVDSAAGETSVYAYDALDRLTSWTLNQNAPETYTYDAQGNLDVKNGLDLNYNDAAHKHAVTSVSNQSSVNSYQYDQNGNQITRSIGSDTFNLIYDAENRLVEVKKNNVTISQFTYDGDGARVKSVIGGETIRFVGGYYERKGSQITKYYMAGAARVALRKYTIPQNMTVEYMLGDHLGSTSITTDTNGALISEIRYKPWGETRYTSIDAPANTSPAYELTRYQYTGQYSYDAEFGLKYYGARFYDSAVGRFVSADTVIPGGTQGYDRFAYTYNNPLRYNDPTGHIGCSPDERDEGSCEEDDSSNMNNSTDDEVCYRPSDTNCYTAEHLYEMLTLVLLFHADSIYLVGSALEQMRNDPQLLAFQTQIGLQAMADPRYGKTDYILTLTQPIKSISFGGNRADAPMAQQLLDPFNPKYAATWAVASNEISWMLRKTSVYATATVGKDGNVNAHYKVYDVLDLRPDWQNKGTVYNVITSVLGGIWHEGMGASEPKVYAGWTTNFDPWP